MTSFQLGQLYIVGFYGTEYNDELEELLSKYGVGGVILFKRNLNGNVEDLKKLTNKIQSRAKELGLPPLFITIDHEGGRVHRLENMATHFPPPGKLNDLSLKEIEEIGFKVNRELKELGFNMILGPVLDLSPTTGTKSHIADRSFGVSVQEVSERSHAMMKGYLKNDGLIPVPKHFPGYGDAEIDPHYALPSNSMPLEELQATYLAPFQNAFDKGYEFLMSAHILNKKIDPKYPCTVSKAWGEILRHDMRFNGVWMSDDLCMKSIWDYFGPQEFTLLGLNAGLDILLVCHSEGEFEGSIHQSFEVVYEQWKNNGELVPIMKNAIKKIEKLKRKYL